MFFAKVSNSPSLIGRMYLTCFYPFEGQLRYPPKLPPRNVARVKFLTFRSVRFRFCPPIHDLEQPLVL